jgi:hypothetical protein
MIPSSQVSVCFCGGCKSLYVNSSLLRARILLMGWPPFGMGRWCLGALPYLSYYTCGRFNVL